MAEGNISISVKANTYARLKQLGTVGATFDEVISELLNEHEQNVKNSDK